MNEGEGIKESIMNGSLNSKQISEVLNFKIFGNEEGFILLENNDVGTVPKTPVNRKALGKKDKKSDNTILQATCLLGDPIGYTQESDGKLVNNIFPHKNSSVDSTSDSFDAELDLHTENAFHAVSPDYLLLFCLRGDPRLEAITYVSSINHVLKRLTKVEIKFFLKEEYNFLSDYNKKNKSCRIDLNQRKTVFYGDPSSPFFRFDPDFMVEDNMESYNNLEKLRDIAWQVARPIKLKKGDLLIIDNRKAVHARSNFTATFEGNDRWIQRTFALSNKKHLSEKTKKSNNVFELITEL